MSFDIKKCIYDHSPLFVQNIMCTLAGYQRVRNRYGDDFDKLVEFYKQARKWNKEEICAFQLDKLQKLAKHAYETVPFYRKKFNEIDLRPEDISSIDDWEKIPVITKDDLRIAGIEVISEKFDRKKLVVTRSGGSTGTPLNCYHNKSELKHLYASFWVYHRPGVNIKDKYATFQGLELIPPHQKKGPYWRMNKAMNQRLYSIFHLSDKTIADYIEDLDKYKPVYFTGYSNSLYLLAKLAEETNIIPKWHPKAVYSTSEQLNKNYKQTIERVFQTRVWDAYSQFEACGSISQCKCGHYHYDHAYGYMEFEDKSEENGTKLAEIICTSFINWAWPILRYRIGDMVEYKDIEQCLDCGHAGPLITEIKGRKEDFIVTPDGSFFPHISVRNAKGVRFVQLEQISNKEVVIRYVPAEDFQIQNEKDMLKEFDKLFRGQLLLIPEKAKDVKRTARGKILPVINNIK